MATQTVDFAAIQEALGALRDEVSRLGKRLAALESAGSRPAAPPLAAPPKPEEMNEELMLIISAAVAAYLGVQPRIRQVRLIGSTTWSQHGRATIQASHAITTARSQP